MYIYIFLFFFFHIGLFEMFLFTNTVIKSDLQKILLLMCFSAYLSNKCKFSQQHFYVYFYI